MAKITIYIPTKNRLSLLRRAVDSCLNQTYQFFELIIVNDGSTDGTEEYLQLLTKKDQRIKIINNTKSKGANHARNQAINAATGKYITGLDDDDLIRNNHFERLIEAYSDEYSFVCTNQFYKGKGVKGRYYGKIDLEKILAKNIVGNQIFTSLKRMHDIGGFDESLSACQDYDLWTRLILKYGVGLKIKAATYIVDDNATNRITTSSKAFQGYWDCYTKYRGLMNLKQRATRLMEIRKIQMKKISFKKVCLFGKYVGFINALRLYIKLMILKK